MFKIFEDVCDENLLLIKNLIKKAKLISFPTDTIYALACDATNFRAVEKIFSAKQRPNNKALPVFVRNIDEAKKIVEFNEKALLLAEEFFPGPLTLVLRAKKDNKLAKNLYLDKNTVAIRIPSNMISQKILESVEVPLVGTSANLSNMTPASNIFELEKYFKDFVSCVVLNNQVSVNIPSTIIDLSEDFPRLIRQGALSIGLIENFLGEKINNG